MSRDFQYRNEANKGSVNERELIRKLPLSDMIKFGLIELKLHVRRKNSQLAAFF